jgi:branched-chain amino acid transport system ATP-binding protein
MSASGQAQLDLRPDRPQRCRQDHRVQLPDRLLQGQGGKIELNVRGSKPTSSSCWRTFKPTDFVSPKLRQSPVYKMFGGTHLVNRAGLARTFQNIRLFKEMSVLENLLVAQHMWVNRNMLAGILNTKGYRKAESDALDHAFYWLEVVDLVDCANRLAGELSYGQQRRLEIARAMCTRRRSSASTNRPPASTPRKPKR